MSFEHCRRFLEVRRIERGQTARSSYLLVESKFLIMTASTHHIHAQRYHRALRNLPMDRVGYKNAKIKKQLTGITYGHIVEDSKSKTDRSIIRKNLRNKIIKDRVLGLGAVSLVLALTYLIMSFIF